ncbi:hypothetical protein [Peterkaempfera bronchialis]|nr:hypothetical protein [Peterkaempfera bronchialis]
MTTPPSWAPRRRSAQGDIPQHPLPDGADVKLVKPAPDDWDGGGVEQPTMELRAASVPPQAIPAEISIPPQAIPPEISIPAQASAPAVEEAAPGPVFVDSTGRRGRNFRRVGWLIGVVCVGFAGVLATAVMSAGSGAPELDIPDPAQRGPAAAPQSPSAAVPGSGTTPAPGGSTAPGASNAPSPAGGTGPQRETAPATRTSADHPTDPSATASPPTGTTATPARTATAPATTAATAAPPPPPATTAPGSATDPHSPVPGDPDPSTPADHTQQEAP